MIAPQVYIAMIFDKRYDSYRPYREVDEIKLRAMLPKNGQPLFSRKAFKETQQLSIPGGVILWKVIITKRNTNQE